jgi:hypothetical protein
MHYYPKGSDEPVMLSDIMGRVYVSYGSGETRTNKYFHSFAEAAKAAHDKTTGCTSWDNCAFTCSENLSDWLQASGFPGLRT